jgi:hypothetical protein
MERVLKARAGRGVRQEEEGDRGEPSIALKMNF